MGQNRKYVIITSTTQRSIEKILKRVEGRKFKWAYFGDNVSRAITIERLIGNNGKRLQIAEKLQESAHSLQQSYIDLIGELGIKHNSILWWAGAISEKNAYDKLFLNCCYMRVAEQLLEECEGRIIFFFESPALIKTLSKLAIKNISLKKKALPKKNYTLYTTRIDAHPHLLRLKDIFKFFVSCGYFIADGWRKYILIGRYKNNFNFAKLGESTKPSIFIHSFIDQRSFIAEGRYQDTYFGELPAYFKREGYDVFIIPYILATISFTNAIRYMINSGERFIVPTLFLKPIDYIKAILKSLQVPGRFGKFELQDMDISDLVKEESWRDFFSLAVPRNLFFYYMVKRWKESKIKVYKLIYTFENHAWEKVLCYAMKKFYPNTKMVAYQHSCIPNMYLSYFPSKKERDVMPAADIIICNGAKPAQLLKQYGYYEHRIKIGPSIRYAYLYNNLNGGNKNIGEFILVVLSVGSEAFEFSLKIIEAFKNGKKRVVIKPHPISPIENFLKELNIDLPQNIEIINTPIHELMPNSKVLIYTSSTVCFEALMRNIPVVHVTSEYIIDKNPLHEYPESFFVANNSREIREVVEQIDTYSEKNNKSFKNIVKENFSDPKTTDWKVFRED
jgi:hypothetical protein